MATFNVPAGKNIKLSFDVTNLSKIDSQDVDLTIQVQCKIYYGRWWTTPGALVFDGGIREYTILAGKTGRIAPAVCSPPTVSQEYDVGLVIWAKATGAQIYTHQWDSVFFVQTLPVTTYSVSVAYPIAEEYT